MAEDMMTPAQAASSEAREKSFESREGKGFRAINPQTLDSDPELREFLSSAFISRSRKGDGVFISGAQNADTSKFRKYGIPVNGALIVPVKGDVSLEAERISLLASTIRYEISREDQNKKEKLKKLALNQADKEFEKRMLVLQPDIQKFQQVADEYKESLGSHIVTGEKDRIELVAGEFHFVLVSTFTDYNLPEEIRYSRGMPKMVPESNPEKIKDFFDEELRIAPIRERLLPIATGIMVEIEKEFSGSIGNSSSYQKVLPRNLEIAGLHSSSHSIKFRGQTYYWADESFNKFKDEVENAVKEIRKKDSEAWEIVRGPSKGLPVENPHKTGMSSILKIGDKEVSFGIPKSTMEAYRWALENGSMDMEEYRLREEIKKGGIIERRAGRDGHSPDHFVKVYNYEYSVGGVRLGSEDSYLYNLASDLIRERDNAILLKERAQVDDLETRAREAGAKRGYEFVGTRDRAGVKEFGFIINRGTAGWRVREKLAEGVPLEGKLSTGWSIWVKESDLDDLQKYFKS